LPTAAAPPAPSSPSGQEKSDALTPPPPAAQPSHHPSSAEPVKAASAKAPVARTPAHKPVAYVPPLSIVHFDYNSNDLSSESYRTLDRIAAYLKDTPSARIAIKGYTDSYGSEGYNQSLSRFRANIVKNYLLGHGIDAGRMIVAGLGSEDPLYSNDTPSGRSANRRVEIRIRNR
jgi:general secretion pathway protein A